MAQEHWNKTDAAHEAFRRNDPERLAHELFEKGEAAVARYELDFDRLWDLRVYGAFNAAGGALEQIGDFDKSRTAYKRALKSCIRIGGLEWKPNIDNLHSAIERVSRII